MDIPSLEAEISKLRNILHTKEEELLRLKAALVTNTSEQQEPVSGLPRWIVERYSRQWLVHELGGVKGAHMLTRASVLVVGAGGLGCPAAAYLAGAGVGRLGIVDHDAVELSNIHRQLLHSELTVGMSKAQSAAMALRKINSTITITPYDMLIDSSNAMDLINQHDVVVDATDNVVTRYLLNDACVLSGRPLVSASALKMEGQFTVYNYRKDENSERGPCMRCIFPQPPPPETVGSCSQNGVLGPIPGTLGCLQAVETIKVILGICSLAGSLLLYDGLESSFRKVKLRKRDPACAVCSDNPTITQLIDYTLFCKSQASDKDMKLEILNSNERISPKVYADNVYQNVLKSKDKNITCEEISLEDDLYNSVSKSLLLDVRSEGEFNMCKIDGSINLPIDRVSKECERLAKFVKEKHIGEVYFVCRRGNDSQIAAREFKQKFDSMFPSKEGPIVKDLEGGLHQWAKTVDSEFPVY